jgi:hypothetical protein
VPGQEPVDGRRLDGTARSPSSSMSTRVPCSSRTQRAGANLRAKTAIRGVSPSSSLALACGSATTSRSTDRPAP